MFASVTNNTSGSSFAVTPTGRPLPNNPGLVLYSGLDLITRPVVTEERLRSLDNELKGTWKSKKATGRAYGLAQLTVEGYQRCPALTVDTVYVRIPGPGQEPEILLGVFDKTVDHRNGDKRRYHGLVLPGGGHVERIGERMLPQTASYFERPHGSVIEAASKESLEEIGIKRSESLFPPTPYWLLDDPESEPRQHCFRVIFGACLPPGVVPKPSDEITSPVWVRLGDVQKVINHEIGFFPSPGADPVYFTIGHDKMLHALMQTPNWLTFLARCHAANAAANAPVPTFGFMPTL